MLFAHAFDRSNLLAWIRRHRKRPMRVYGLALGLLVAATLLRLGLHQQLSNASPFTAYGVPILFVSLVGGFGPGMVTLAASLIMGSILFLPPAFSLALADEACWPLLMFGALGSIYVVLVSGMIASILRHDEHQQFLFGELRHRSRNLFAVVQGMVSRTLMESASLQDAKQAIETRLASLARTHAMLADNGWNGAPLDQIVSEELTSFANQIDCGGCELILDTPAAQNFSLIIHELATNAVKHGALSRPGGRVAVAGSVLSNGKAEFFRFVWTESGGPAVSTPVRRGFGSSVLNTMAKRFACRVEADFRPEGLVYELQVPLVSVLASPPASQSRGVWLKMPGLFPSSKHPISETDPTYSAAQRCVEVSPQNH